jgi:hypothetical protein
MIDALIGLIQSQPRGQVGSKRCDHAYVTHRHLTAHEGSETVRLFLMETVTSFWTIVFLTWRRSR